MEAMAEEYPAPSTSATGDVTRVLFAVNQSSEGYPNPSISSLSAFHWILNKLIHLETKHRFKLLILHVQVSDEDGFEETDSLYATNEDFKHLQQEDKARGVHLLQHFVNHCNDLEVSCKAWIKRGDPRDVICKEVERIHPDILVLGSRGLKTIDRIFVATVSDYCSKHADCPVLVIKRNKRDAPKDPIDD